MWEFLKPSSSTDTSELQELRKENRAMRLDLARALKVSQELAVKQQESLDRVITAKFDVPVTTPRAYAQPIRSSIPMEHMSDVLGIEDDGEFIEAVTR
jgi:hypothetical protein